MSASEPAAAAPELSWPPGSRAAAALTFDVDAESAILAADPASADRRSVMSRRLITRPRIEGSAR